MGLRCALLLVLALAWASGTPSVFSLSRGLPDAKPHARPWQLGARGPSGGASAFWGLTGVGVAVFVTVGSQRRRASRRPLIGAKSLRTSLQPGQSSSGTGGQSGSGTGNAKAPDAWLWDFEEVMARLVGAPEGPLELDEADYRRHVSDAQKQMRLLAKASKPFTLDQSGNAGSVYGIGRREYQQRNGRLDLSRFRGIMSFDAAAKQVTVGAKTDFKSLSRFLLDRRFIVPIVPEVDTVTVGGAISGVVMESASFRHGFVHNTVQRMDVLLPDGSVVSCSREKNAELFTAIPHSYGTLGYVLSATLLVVPAELDVMVKVQELPTPRDAVDGIARATRDPAVDFVEGIIFGDDRALTMTASMCSPEVFKDDLPTVVLPDDGRYIDVVCKHLDSSRDDWHSKNVSCAFRMSTFDFLYRWDCDIFWATRRTNFLGVPAVRKALGRACLRSKVLWPVGTFLRGTKEAIAQMAWDMLGEAGLQLGFTKPTERIIQDLGVRFEQVPAFAKDLEEHAELPFWMCPIKCRGLVEEQPLFPLPDDAAFVMDVASFGAVPQDMKSGDPLFHNRGIERVLQKYDGMKAFYSDVLYSREYIYQKFNGAVYDQLKSKYDPNGVLPHILDKVLTA